MDNCSIHRIDEISVNFNAIVNSVFDKSHSRVNGNEVERSDRRG